MSFYRVDIRGLAGSQQVQNTLWFQDVPGLLTLLSSPYARAAALVGAVHNAFLLDSDGIFPTDNAWWLHCLSSQYKLTGYSVSVRGGGLGFPEETAAPVEFAAPDGFVGKQTGDTDGVDSVAVIKFGLSYAPVTEGLYQPRRRNIRYGPLPSTSIENDGLVRAPNRAEVNQLAARLAQPVQGDSNDWDTANTFFSSVLGYIGDYFAGPIGDFISGFDDIVFNPVAYGRKALPVGALEGFADVNSGICQPYSSRLKSRRVAPRGN